MCLEHRALGGATERGDACSVGGQDGVRTPPPLGLERKVQASAAAEEQRAKLQLELSEATRLRDEYQAEAGKQRKAASESLEMARAQKLSLDKATRAQQEMLQRV